MNIKIHKIFCIVFLLFICSLSLPSWAETNILYKGLHFGKAWIYVNGKLVKLKPGETSKQGVELFTVNEDEIFIRVDGKRYKYRKGNKRGILFEEEVIISRDFASGNYWAKGFINHYPVTFIVDTGASFVTMSKKMARNMRIKTGNKRVTVQTATKEEQAYLVRLESVSVGGIELHDVPALITNHNNPPMPLLGMSFLSHMEISQKDNLMLIRYTGK